MNIGDLCHFTAGAHPVVVTVCYARDDTLVLVQNHAHEPARVRSSSMETCSYPSRRTAGRDGNGLTAASAKFAIRVGCRR